MKGVGHFTCIGEMRNAHKILFGNPEGRCRMYGITILKIILK
jgi:hypothetical protein